MQTSEQEPTAVKQCPSLPHFNQIHGHSLHFKTDPSKHRMTPYFSHFLHLSSSTLVTHTPLCWPHKPCAKILQWVTITVMGNSGAGTLEQSWPEGTTASPIIPTHHGMCRWHLQSLWFRLFHNLKGTIQCWFRLAKPANQTTVLGAAAASGSSQPGLQLTVSSRSEVPSTGSPCAGTGEPKALVHT